MISFVVNLHRHFSTSSLTWFRVPRHFTITDISSNKKNLKTNGVTLLLVLGSRIHGRVYVQYENIWLRLWRQHLITILVWAFDNNCGVSSWLLLSCLPGWHDDSHRRSTWSWETPFCQQFPIGNPKTEARVWWARFLVRWTEGVELTSCQSPRTNEHWYF